jgi:hypothetical protein
LAKAQLGQKRPLRTVRRLSGQNTILEHKTSSAEAGQHKAFIE